MGIIVLWLIGAIVAGMTSFYMFRLLFMTFYGESRVDHHTAQHIHESPKVDDDSVDGARCRIRGRWYIWFAGVARAELFRTLAGARV